MPRSIYISDLKANEWIEGVFSVQNTQQGTTRNGKPFLKCLLGDKTGQVAGRMWNASEELIRGLPTNGFVFMEGQSQAYQGEMQIIIQNIRPTRPEREDLMDLIPSTEYDIDQMFAEVQEWLLAMSSPTLRALAQAYLDDQQLMSRFKQAPAAVQLHHAFLGGLLEHTHSLMRLGRTVAPLYPKINPDIVLMGLFLHDLGKCVELSWNSVFEYTDEGRLVGHIARGAIWLQEKVAACAANGTPIPEDVTLVLQHIILSHHGRPEYGALMIPASPEAILISMLDNVDAKMNMALIAARSGKGNEELNGNFTDKQWALETRLYRPDPLENERG